MDKKNKEKKEGTYQSEVELYHTIWSSRPHICELSGKKIEHFFGTDFWYNCFAHVFAKGKFPKWKFLPDNILLVHPDVHNAMDYGTLEQLTKLISEEGINKLNKQKAHVLKITHNKAI